MEPRGWVLLGNVEACICASQSHCSLYRQWRRASEKICVININCLFCKKALSRLNHWKRYCEAIGAFFIGSGYIQSCFMLEGYGAFVIFKLHLPCHLHLYMPCCRRVFKELCTHMKVHFFNHQLNPWYRNSKHTRGDLMDRTFTNLQQCWILALNLISTAIRTRILRIYVISFLKESETLQRTWETPNDHIQF